MGSYGSNIDSRRSAQTNEFRPQPPRSVSKAARCSPLDSNRFQSDVLLGSNLIRCHVVDQSDSAEKVHEQATKFQLLETHLA